MGKAILVIDMPESCGECFFCGDVQELSVGYGLYKKISRCLLAADIKDPWKDLSWQSEHKAEWCPLKPVPEEQLLWHDDERDDWARGYNDCLYEITRDDNIDRW